MSAQVIDIVIRIRKRNKIMLLLELTSPTRTDQSMLIPVGVVREIINLRLPLPLLEQRAHCPLPFHKVQPQTGAILDEGVRAITGGAMQREGSRKH